MRIYKMSMILTNLGLRLLSDALLSGTMPILSKVKFGDGDGAEVIASVDMTDITRMVYETGIAGASREDGLELLVEIPISVGGFTIREIGVYDDSDRLIAIEGGLNEYKPTFEDSPTKISRHLKIAISNTSDIDIEFNTEVGYATTQSYSMLNEEIEDIRDNMLSRDDIGVTISEYSDNNDVVEGGMNPIVAALVFGGGGGDTSEPDTEEEEEDLVLSVTNLKLATFDIKAIVSNGGLYNAGINNITTYGSVIQRTDNVSDDRCQFAVHHGARNASGKTISCITPFQIMNDNTVILGTATALWSNTSGTVDFSTHSTVTDDKSGKFIYYGNIPFPNNASHVRGVGYGILNANNTASNGGYNTSSSIGLYQHNGKYNSVPLATSGWKGCVAGANIGYTNKGMITLIDYTNNTPTLTLNNPSGYDNTGWHANMICSEGVTLSTSVISGICLVKAGTTQIRARVFHSNGSSSADWVYAGTANIAIRVFVLADGRAVSVDYDNGVYLHTAYNTRTKIESGIPYLGSAYSNDSFVSVGPNEWAFTNKQMDKLCLQFIKFDIMSNRFLMGGKYFITNDVTVGADHLFKLNEGRLMAVYKTTTIYTMAIMDIPTDVEYKYVDGAAAPVFK